MGPKRRRPSLVDALGSKAAQLPVEGMPSGEEEPKQHRGSWPGWQGRGIMLEQQRGLNMQGLTQEREPPQRELGERHMGKNPV